VNNARVFLDIAGREGSFDSYIWKFTEGKTIHSGLKGFDEMPVKTELSDLAAKEMKKEGFRFLGSVTLYAHFQAIGIINDHLISCFRYSELTGV
jgi:DNA-3-methyladenine glycosylase I